MITDGTIELRPYVPDDALTVLEAVHESATDLRRWMPWAHPTYSLADAQAWTSSAARWFDERTAYEFKIVSRAGQYLGGCGLNQFDLLNRRANLGYWVRRSVRGQGVATAAALLVHRWACAQTTLHRLEILVAADNHASLRVATKTGAVREGMLRDRLLLHEQYHDAVLFSLLCPRPV